MVRMCLKLCKHKTTKTLLIAKIGVAEKKSGKRSAATNKGDTRVLSHGLLPPSFLARLSLLRYSHRLSPFVPLLSGPTHMKNAVHLEIIASVFFLLDGTNGMFGFKVLVELR